MGLSSSPDRNSNQGFVDIVEAVIALHAVSLHKTVDMQLHGGEGSCLFSGMIVGMCKNIIFLVEHHICSPSDS